jgi:transposase-like protein
MDQRTTSGSLTSSPTWEGLHVWLRNAIQALIQEALEAEVAELLCRVRYQRRGAVDAPVGYRNGYGKPRKLTTPMGTITLRRPRVRGLEERFESRILPLFARRTKEVAELLPELYRAVPARARRGRLRPGPAGAAGRGGAAFRPYGGAPEGAVAGGVGGLAHAAAG